MSDKLVKASECKCIECGEQAVAFWPCLMDVPSYPYCRKCLDKIKQECLMELFKIDEKHKKK